jgi:S1-C subfamily serine protease
MRARAVAFLTLIYTLAAGLFPATTQAASDTLTDFPVPNGYYFTQAGGGAPDSGFSITNDGGIGFWDAFQQLGGANGIGYPSSQRFVWNGFVAQATQKAILQWNPQRGQADLVNTFDLLAQRGLDPWLQSQKQTPPSFDNAADSGKSWNQVVARHLAELDWNAAIKARYFADSDPINHFGLPQAYADEGNVLVIRCQRAVFQQWKRDVPWANAGDVTIANGGDLAKEANLLPAAATVPEPASNVIVAPLGPTLALSKDQINAVHAAATTMMPSLVRVISDLGGGEASLGSGIIIDQSGIILTNSHVVEGALQTVVTLSDGRTLPARIIGQDPLADVAVLSVNATGLRAAARGSSTGLQPGTFVVALGFSDFFPAPPTVRVGQFSGYVQDQLQSTRINYIRSNVFILPGDSGGPLINLQGQVVGVDTAIDVSERGPLRITGFSLGIDSVLPVANQIIATGKSPQRPYLGVVPVPMTPDVARQSGIPFHAGLLLAAVSLGSPAARAGMVAGDVMISVDDTAIASITDLEQIIAGHQVGDTINVTLVAPSGVTRTVPVTLAARPQ